MKKSLSLVLALVFVLGIAGTAFAANPFSDVPAKHWAYDAVNKLVKDGVVDGYNDGTFRGDKTMTRYEMAQIVAKAIAKEDKANAANKALIEKLSAEFSAELNNLGVRVTNVEKKVNALGNIKFNGEIREQYNWMSGNTKNTYSRLRLNLTAPISEGWSAVGRIEAQNTVSETTDRFAVVRGYAQGPLWGANVQAGRIWVGLGQMYTGTDKDTADGAQFTIGNELKFTAGTAKIQQTAATASAASVNDWYKYAQIAYPFSKTFNATAFYLKNNQENLYKTWGVGFAYTGMENLKLIAEYGKNTATDANDAKAWATRLTFKGADQNKADSFGVWVGYRSADANYDQLNFSTLDKAGYTKMNNVKGFEVGFDYAPIKNTKFKFVYMNTEVKTTTAKLTAGDEKHQFLGEVNFFF